MKKAQKSLTIYKEEETLADIIKWAEENNIPQTDVVFDCDYSGCYYESDTPNIIAYERSKRNK